MIGFDTLYSWVRELPIVDWHNHLDLAVLAENKPLGSLYEVWVKADPYKHRAMRICGEPERVITGDASEDEKWAAWTRTLPKLVGNPLFAWAKMELEKFKVESILERLVINKEVSAQKFREYRNVNLNGEILSYVEYMIYSLKKLRKRW
jgi:glucuronate isomerase